MKYICYSVLGGLLLVALTWIGLVLPMCNTEDEASLLSNSQHYIAHAAGAVDERTYLNCKEGLLSSLENGYTYIELDLGLTADSNLVCVHDWPSFNKKTGGDSLKSDAPIVNAEFLKKKIHGKYTPLTLEEALSIRENHPYVIVTDKISNPNILNKFFRKNRESIMVEAFSVSDYIELKEAGYVPMMSLWCFDFTKLFRYFVYYPLKYSVEIDWICVHSSSDMKSLRALKRLFNCKVAMYSSNSASFFREHLGKEVDLIYTDNWNLKTKSNNDMIHTATY